jgi:amidase
VKAGEYLELDATAAAGLVRSGELRPTELVEAAIERIEAVDGKLNAVVERSFEAARIQASTIARQSALAGVPFLAKDMNIEVKGLRLTASCRFLQDLPAASEDSPLARRWREAGLCILGRTNTPEFAGEFVTEPTLRGATANPWDFTRSPGGSSGGAAAAVASGMVPIAHGTDSGGSIRVPAAACGLVGLKPSRGRVPVGPHHDELAGGLDCEHVLTRSVRDSALMLDLTAGPELGSRYPAALPNEPFVNALKRAPESLRIGLAINTPSGMQPAAEIAEAIETVAKQLAGSGHRVKAFRYPGSAAGVADSAAVIWMSATAEEVRHYRSLAGRAPRNDELEALTLACIELGEQVSAAQFLAARRALTRATREMALAFLDVDVLLLPTLAKSPVPTGSIDGRTDKFDLERWNRDSYGFAPFTELFNVTGQPAISLPLVHGRDGLPIGVQFAAPLGQEALLLSLAAWFEREMPWRGRLLALQRRFL